MNFEEIKARYMAGDTDLKAETKFLYDTQGINAVYDFARSLDEEIGAAPYNLVMMHADKLEAQKNALQINQQEAQRIALAKAAQEAEKAYKQSEQIRFAESLTTSKNTPMQDLVKPAPPQLFPNMGIIDNTLAAPDVRNPGGRIGGATEGGSGGLANLGDVRIKEILEAGKKNPKTVLVIAAGLALIAYFYFKKK
jgi:hypothetical protein